MKLYIIIFSSVFINLTSSLFWISDLHPWPLIRHTYMLNICIFIDKLNKNVILRNLRFIRDFFLQFFCVLFRIFWKYSRFFHDFLTIFAIYLWSNDEIGIFDICAFPEIFSRILFCGFLTKLAFFPRDSLTKSFLKMSCIQPLFFIFLIASFLRLASAYFFFYFEYISVF